VRLENDFTVPASPESAWDLLNDVPAIVPCIPGAELKEVVSENRWKAVMHVKLGPIALQFDADIERQEVDETARRVVLAAKAREVRGRGGAHAKIESSLADAAEGTEVKIATDLRLQGTIAQYGRGIVADVSSQLTRQFADCLASKLTAEPPPAADAAPADGTGTPASGTLVAPAPAPTPAPAPATAAAPPAPQPVEPIGGVRLGLRAIWRSFLSLFRRRTR
jgi:uncharacterized protein